MSVNVRFESIGKLERASGTFNVHIEDFTFWFYPYSSLTLRDFLDPPDYYRPILLYSPCCGERAFEEVPKSDLLVCKKCSVEFPHHGFTKWDASFDELVTSGEILFDSTLINPLATNLAPFALREILEPMAMEVNKIYFSKMDSEVRGEHYLALAEKYSGKLV